MSILKQYNHIHLIGIGGINVSAIAKLLLSQGKKVSGSDLVASDITRELQTLGADVKISHNRENVTSDVDLVIYSDAVPTDNPERQAASARNIPQMSNFEFWGKYAADKKVIAISGTNGKSTTTAMLGLILEAAGFDPTVVVGTRVLQWGSNIRVGKSEWLAIEADEYRAHMLEFNPYIAVITNIAPDHLDYYRDLGDITAHFQKWIGQIPRDGGLVLNQNDPASQKLRLDTIKTKKFNSVTPASDLSFLRKQESSFNTSGLDPRFRGDDNKGNREGIHLQVPGDFNIANALAAAEAARFLDIDEETIVTALNNFTGTWRRFEKVGEYNGATIISDYAHHPDGIKVTLQAAREKYPNHRLVVLYQPHQHNRTRKLFDQFVQAFDLADELILAEIYDVPGRTEASDQSVSSRDLAAAIVKYPNTTPRIKACPVLDTGYGAGSNPSSLRFGGQAKRRGTLDNPLLFKEGEGGGYYEGVGDGQRLNTDHVSYAPDLAFAKKMAKDIIKPGDILLVMGAGDVDSVARNLLKQADK